MGPSRNAARRLGVAVLLTVGGLVLAVLFAIPALFAPLDPLGLFVAITVLSELGFAAAAVGFVLMAGVGAGYLRIRRPDRRTFAFVVGGTLGLFGFRIVGLIAVRLLDLPVAGNAITEFPGLEVGRILLVLIPLSILVVGPAEELLFRGAIQRTLEAGFSRLTAIGITGALFALIHVPTTVLADPEPLGVGTALVLLFGLSVILSYLYAWTENLVVPMLAHGLYDALVFAMAYFVVEVQKLPTVVPGS